ncbi:MAG TPA: hypothetical protein VHD38_02815 [Candidatus Paceibacterota bacterium]|nr:hypothetical protein [Candidatus Paceibacterota bacterium]
MPPVSSPQIQQEPPMQLSKKRGGAGATVGIVIIVVLMLFGGLYFWGAHLNAQKTQDQLPLIPADNSQQ